jgi:hypothetical protein
LQGTTLNLNLKYLEPAEAVPVVTGKCMGSGKDKGMGAGLLLVCRFLGACLTGNRPAPIPVSILVHIPIPVTTKTTSAGSKYCSTNLHPQESMI